MIKLATGQRGMGIQSIIIKIVSYVVAYVGGVFTVIGKGWVNDYFKIREELRKKLDKPYNLASDLIAEGTKDGYVLPPKQLTRSRAFKIAARLEVLNRQDISFDLRQFINKWGEYSDLVSSMKKNERTSTVENIQKQIDLRVELDDLADLIFKAMQKEYQNIPKLRIRKSL